MTASATSPNEHLNAPWRRALHQGEIAGLLAMRDIRSLFSIALNWGIVFAAFGLVAFFPNPLTILVALLLIGARQLGFAVLMHEASHRSLFARKSTNDALGNWLCAYPIWSDLGPYRPYHLSHHARTGSAEDPDIGLVRPFPITPRSLRRKLVRDLTGQTGLKFARAGWRRTFAVMRGDPEARRAALGFALTNAVLLGILIAFGYPALYLLWVIAWLTTYTAVTRIRSIAEHALTPDADDPLGNTRTTRASWWERLFIAPNRVNYHLEHHLLMTVPHYNLPRMHRLLSERGILANACLATGYFEILRNATSDRSGTDSEDSDPEEQLSHVNGI